MDYSIVEKQRIEVSVDNLCITSRLLWISIKFDFFGFIGILDNTLLNHG